MKSDSVSYSVIQVKRVRISQLINVVSLKKIEGFIFGPKSLTFKRVKGIKKMATEWKESWKFFSIVTQKRTYDFKFHDKPSMISFITAITSISHKFNPKVPQLSNKYMIHMLIIRLKLEGCALKNGITISQLFYKALYLHALDLPETTRNDRKFKKNCLTKL